MLEDKRNVFKINNVAELAWYNSWCKRNGKSQPFRSEPPKYPIYVCPAGKVTGWTDHADRNLRYYSFEKFLSLT